MSNTKPKNKEKSSTKSLNKTIFTERDNYNVTLKYSDEAIKNDLIKFTAKSKEPSNEIEFVMSLAEIAEVIVQHLNTDLLSILNSKTRVIPMVNVVRTISGTAYKDFKKGEFISFNFPVPTPYEMALAEEALGLARIDGKVTEFPSGYMKRATKSIQDKTKEFAEIAYASLIKKNNPDEEAPVVDTVVEQMIEAALKEEESANLAT